MTGIYVGPFHVRFEFISQTATHVVIKKPFNFTFEGKELAFDPLERRPESSPAFVLLQGLVCVDLTLDPTALVIFLSNACTIRVSMDVADFEPVELLGYRGNGQDELEFYYVF
ncbi:MAG: hypothetical protein ABL866_14325 [Devosia sp.]